MAFTFLSPLADHLWQSTLFAIGAGLLTLALKKNRARTRYWIWWIASLKFLIPFAPLMRVGSYFSRLTDAPAPDVPSLSFVVFTQVAQPFTFEAIPAPVPQAAMAVSQISVLLAAASIAWLCGCGFLFLRWGSRWWRMRGMTRRASVLTDGREFEALRRLERSAGTRRPIDIVSSPAAMEPAVFGVFRPVLVWPAGLRARLADEELEAILMHELAHVRRRDNLTSALHMVIEALFWFHPLVWWLGVRLVDERERACDEDVLQWGGASHVYAEGILKVCEFCLESPLICAAGITGSDLKKRIEAIMRNSIARQLGFSRIVLLALAALGASVAPVAMGVVNATAGRTQFVSAIPPIPGPVVLGQQREAPVPTAEVQVAANLQTAPQAPVPRETFEVVSIRPADPAALAGGRGGPGARGGGPAGPGGLFGPGPMPCPAMIQLNPGRVVLNNVTVYRLLVLAYGKNCRAATEMELITGAPEWIRTTAFDIQATLPAGAPSYTVQELLMGEAPRLQGMIQNLLADRFQLALHRTSKDAPLYNLVVVKPGKIILSADQAPPPPLVLPTGPPPPSDPSAPPPQFRGGFSLMVDGPDGKVRLRAASISLATLINVLQGQEGRLVIDKTGMKGLYDIDQVMDVGPFEIGPGAVSVWPEIMQQLGLKLDPARGPVEVLVIDRVERPSGN